MTKKRRWPKKSCAKNPEGQPTQNPTVCRNPRHTSGRNPWHQTAPKPPENRHSNNPKGKERTHKATPPGTRKPTHLESSEHAAGERKQVSEHSILLKTHLAPVEKREESPRSHHSRVSRSAADIPERVLGRRVAHKNKRETQRGQNTYESARKIRTSSSYTKTENTQNQRASCPTSRTGGGRPHQKFNSSRPLRKLGGRSPHQKLGGRRLLCKPGGS